MYKPKIEKVCADIERTKQSISELQAKLRALEKLKVEVENDFFINIIRSERISDAELSALMRSLRKEDATPAVAVAAAEKIPRLEDIPDAQTQK